MDKEKDFQPDITCETLETCEFGQSCQRALIIKQEIKYEKSPLESELKTVVKLATCKHPDSLAMLTKAEKALNPPI